MKREIIRSKKGTPRKAKYRNVEDDAEDRKPTNKYRNPKTGEFLVGYQPMGGRPRGARSKLGETFLNALKDDFEKYGAKAIVRARKNDPVAYVKVVASLLPRELDVNVTNPLQNLATDELIARIAELDEKLKPLYDELKTGRRNGTAGVGGAKKRTEAPLLN